MENVAAKVFIGPGSKTFSDKTAMLANKRAMLAENVKKCVLAGLLAMNLMPVHAETIEIDTINVVDADAGVTIGKVVGIMMKMGYYIGIGFFIWGLIMFGLAIKNDEPESKQKALMCIISGIFLVGLKAILTAAGIITVG